ncbi:MAG TPA: PQQ-dependent sugar dehydrogenase [Chitinophagaceae bacterium]|nr:PQQ-dependent sugar dehydrogenase [Chitinophagaceae bacterium]
MKKFLGFIFWFVMMGMKVQAQVLPDGFLSTAATNTSDNWDEPVGAAFSKDGNQLFIWEKGGRVYVNNRRSTDGLHLKQILPVIDISDEVGNWSDMGLLGFALDPNFTASGGYIYLFYVVDRHHLLTNGDPANGYSASENNYFSATIGRITRYTTSIVGGNLVADKSTRKILLGESITTGMPILHKSHSVGTLAFAADGTLMVTTGDGASYDDTDVGEFTNDDPNIHNNTYHVDALANGIITAKENVGAFRSQMLSSLSGKLLRLDPNTGDGMSSNPFFDAAAPRSAKSRVWALGFRNPFRMSIKPGTGSTNPSDGHIGEIFVGDVGFGQAEELNIVKAPGQNFGWPIYEGSAPSAAPNKSYWGYPYVKNRDELRPMCDGRDTLFFHELLRQDNAANNSDIFSDCNGELVRSGIRFIHARPALEWARVDGKVYVPRFNEQGQATWPIIGTPESNVAANNTFTGNASTGGIWLTGGANPSFPPEYKNTLLVSDFGGRWIRRVGIDGSNVVTSVDDFFINNPSGGQGAVVCMAENPIDGSLVYIGVGLSGYGSQTAVRKIVFGGNVPPVAKIGADQYFSASPSLTVHFTGNASYDQDGSVATYAWDFGDPDSGTDNFSELTNPTHVFNTAPGAPKQYVVKLTVTDDDDYTSEEEEFIISLNNTPPQVNIESPVNNSKYKIGSDTAYTLQATVLDNPTQVLTYDWQTSLIHENHSHSNPIDHNEETTAMIERIGCNGVSYHWLITLKVTDDAGLSTSDTSQIYPDCSTTLPLILRSFSVTQKTSVNLVKWTTELESNIEYFEVERSYDGVNFYPINKQDARNIPGTSNYEFSDNSFSPGTIYYRLKMVEHGNIIRYSVIVRTMSDLENLNLRIVPNPVSSNFSVIYTSLQDDKVTIQITDMAGRVLHTLQENVNRGQNVIYLQNLPNWSSGVYFLSIQNKEETKREKFVKTR